MIQLEAEITALHKKLQGSWTSWMAASSMARQQFTDEFIKNYDKFEKKVKMRVLISLLCLDPTRITENSHSIIKLLELAGSDASDEVF